MGCQNDRNACDILWIIGRWGGFLPGSALSLTVDPLTCWVFVSSLAENKASFQGGFTRARELSNRRPGWAHARGLDSPYRPLVQQTASMQAHEGPLFFTNNPPAQLPSMPTPRRSLLRGPAKNTRRPAARAPRRPRVPKIVGRRSMCRRSSGWTRTPWRSSLRTRSRRSGVGLDAMGGAWAGWGDWGCWWGGG